MKNFEKYEEEVKKHDYNFAFDFKNKKNCKLYEYKLL